MTTPVISASNAAGEREKMSFVMPSSFWNEASLAEAPALSKYSHTKYNHGT